MTKSLPRVAVPGGAATAPVRRAQTQMPGPGPVRQTRRITRPCPHAVFVRNVPGHGVEERLLAREIAWCEAHCSGPWAIHYPHTGSGERAATLSFTRAEDAEALRTWLVERDTKDPCPQAHAS